MVAMLTGLSRTEAADLVRTGQVLVDGAILTKGTDRLAEGNVIEIDVPEPIPVEEVGPDPTVSVEVVHLDDDIIVVDKAPAMVVHPGAGHTTGTLVGGLLARFPELGEVGDRHRPGIVHRLDRGTSGLLVVARTPAAYDSLVAQLSARSVVRRYRTLVWGHPESNRGLIDAPIGRSPKHPTKMAVTSSGKEARTRYEVVDRFEHPSPTALLTCHLETGRTHQIRVHLQAIGHSVVGDDRYQGVRQTLPLERPFLHAELLAFAHPGSGEPVTFEAPLPPDLAAVVAGLE